MDIVILGSGNVAAVLGRKFVNAGHKILQIYGRNASAASALAYEWDTESTNYTSLINKHADVYIIAVADSAIETIAKDLKLPGKVVAHTAAAVRMEVLKGVTENYGVLYPLQSLRKELTDSPDVPIYVEAATKKAELVLNELASSITKIPIEHANFDTRTKMHVAAVVVSNFTNYIYSLADEYCKKEGLNFNELLPLIDNTTQRLGKASPKDMQTGPAIRNDQATIEKHLELLQQHPKLYDLYKYLTESIIKNRT